MPNARRIAKVINFGIIYGMGPSDSRANSELPLGEASSYIKRYFERLPGVRAFIDETLAKARETGYVTTMYGRRRYLPSSSPAGRCAGAGRANRGQHADSGYGGRSDKGGDDKLASELRAVISKARMLLQVHDELLLEGQKLKF